MSTANLILKFMLPGVAGEHDLDSQCALQLSRKASRRTSAGGAVSLCRCHKVGLCTASTSKHIQAAQIFLVGSKGLRIVAAVCLRAKEVSRV